MNRPLLQALLIWTAFFALFVALRCTIPNGAALAAILTFGVIDATFVTANAIKIVEGGSARLGL